MSINLFFDGASKSNPGIAGCGYFIEFVNDQGNIVHSFGGYKYLGTKTNNEAEYMALISGLLSIQKLSAHENKEINVYGDSRLVIEQVQGNWKINAINLQPLCEESKILASRFKKIKFEHIDRSLNSKADYYANMAIKHKDEKELIL